MDENELHPEEQQNNSESNESVDSEKIRSAGDAFKHVFDSGVISKTEYFDVFISYKRDNGEDHGQKLAEELYEKLTSDGYKVWLDNEEIGFSTDFEKRIEGAILHSKKVACVIGPAWVESRNCRYELVKAVEFEKRIIPIHYQRFRSHLREKKAEGVLTEKQFRYVDKPQEINFSDRDRFQKSYNDLKAVLNLSDVHYRQHNENLCESFYWSKANKPKSMLMRGTTLSKARILKSRFDRDPDLPAFSEIQNAFLEASQEFVQTEVSNRRMAYIAYERDNYAFASELNLEMKLHNVSTWFDDKREIEGSDKSFTESILNCDNVVVVSKGDVSESELEISFARSNNKRIIKVVESPELKKQLEEDGAKNIYVWNHDLSIDKIISTIVGDREYTRIHSRLLEGAFQWEQSNRSNSKLLNLKEAYEMREWYREAESVGHEPPPGNQMVNFIERSVVWGETQRKRKKLTVWTGIIGGIVLVGLVILAAMLGNRAKKAREAIDSAEKELAAAKESAKEAKEKQDQADSLLTIAQIKEDAALAHADSINDAALEMQRQAEKRLYEASIQLQKAFNDLAKAEQEVLRADSNAVDAQKRSKDAQRRMQKAMDVLKDAEDRLAIAKSTSDSIRYENQARILSAQALEYLYLSDRKNALRSADLARTYLTDSIQSVHPAKDQRQALYDVYTFMLSSQSVLGLDYKQHDRRKSVIERELLELYGPGREVFPDNSTRLVTKSGSEIAFKYGNTMPDMNRINEIVQRDCYNSVSAACVSNDQKWLALGDSSGHVEIIDVETGDTLQQYNNHLYRITVLAFNPEGSQLAIASIDKRLTVLPLDAKGKQNLRAEIIEASNRPRILDLYFWNNSVLVSRTFDDNYKAWATSIGTLRAAIDENATEQLRFKQIQEFQQQQQHKMY